jgi:FtsZ-binding cell division protein ZapB
LSEAVREIEKGSVFKGISLFGRVKKSGLVIIKETEYLLERVGAVEMHYREMEGEKTKLINALYHSEKEKKQEKERKSVEVTSKESDTRQFQGYLGSAQHDQSIARRRKQAAENSEKASKESESRLKLATVLTLGLAAPVTVPGILICKSSANHAREDQQKAQNDISYAQRKIKVYESEISQCKERIRKLDMDICELSKQIGTLNSERDDIHQQRGKINDSIKYLREVLNFWKEFSQLTEDGVKRTSVLQALLMKIGIHNSYTSKLSNHLQSCVSACEKIEQKSKEASDRLFSIDYTCKFCKKLFHELPHLRYGKFCCIHCFEIK